MLCRSHHRHRHHRLGAFASLTTAAAASFLLASLVFASFLALPTHAVRAAIQWGQSSLKDPETFPRFGYDSFSPIDSPDYIFGRSLNDLSIESVHSGPRRIQHAILTTSKQIYAAGITPYGYSTFPAPYEPLKLDLDTNVLALGPGQQPGDNYVVSLAIDPSKGGTYPILSFNNLLILSKNESANTSILWDGPSNSFPWFTSPMELENLVCNQRFCLVLRANIPLVWGNFRESYGSRAIYNNFNPSLVTLPVTNPTQPTDQTAQPWTEPLSLASLGQSHVLSVSFNDPNTTIAWGDNLYHQLGCPIDTDVFCQVQHPFEIQKISTGAQHSLLLSSTGKVYAFGRATHGQLGFKAPAANNSYYEIQEVIFGSSNPVVTAIGTVSHASFAVLFTGEVYGWGSNSILVDETSPAGLFGIDTIYNNYYTPRSLLLFRPSTAPLNIQSVVSVSGLPDCGVEFTVSGGSAYGCTVNMIVNVANKPTSAISRISDNEINDPVQLGLANSTIISWGAIFGDWTGNYTVAMRNSRTNPQYPVTATLPRNRNFKSVSTVRGFTVAVDSSDNSFWMWGMGRSASLFSPEYDLIPQQSMEVGGGVDQWQVNQFIRKPINSKIQTGLLSNNTIHFAAAASNPSSVVATDEDVLIFGHTGGFTHLNFSTDTQPVIVTGHDIKEIRAGHFHYAAVFNDGRLFTWKADLVNGPSGPETGLDSSLLQGYVPLGASLLAHSVAMTTGTTMVHTKHSVSGADGLWTFGDNVNGAMGIGSDQPDPINIPTAVDVSDTTEFPLKPVKIAGGTYHFLVLLESGALLGWGGCQGQLGPNLCASYGNTPPVTKPKIIIRPGALPSSSPITDIAAVAFVTLILDAQGQVFAMGAAPGTNLAQAQPFSRIQGFSKNLIKLPLNDINGVHYRVTKLMDSLATLSLDFSNLAVIATPERLVEQQSSSSLPPARLYSWGDNSPLFNIGPLLGLDSSPPLQLNPSPMWPLSPPSSSPSSPSDIIPFEMDLATYEFSTRTGFALTHTGDLYSWGEQIVNGDPGYFESLAEPIRDGTPLFLSSGISSIAAFQGGLLYVASNGTLGCMSTYSNVGPLCGGAGEWTTFNQPESSFPITQLRCGSRVCIGLPDAPLAAGRVYLLSSRDINLGNGIQDIAGQNIVDVRIIGGSFNSAANVPIFNYIVYNATSQRREFAVAIVEDPAQLTMLNLSAEGLLNPSQHWVVGAYHVLALLNGKIYGWGMNGYGQLSANPSAEPEVFDTYIPVFEPFFSSLPSTIKEIGASRYSSMALMSDGALYTWGYSGRPYDSNSIFPLTSSSPGYVDNLTNVNVTSPVLVATNPYFSRLFSTSTAASISSGGKKKRLFDGRPTIFQGSSEEATINSSSSNNYDNDYLMMDRRSVTAGGEESDQTFFNAFVLFAPPRPAPTASTTGQCQGSPPATNAVCERFADGSSKWIVNGNLQTGAGSSVIVGDDLEIRGNLTITGPGTLVVRLRSDGRVPLVNVTGCAQIDSPITVELTEEQVKSLSKEKETQPQRLIESSCRQTGDLSKLVETKQPKSCRKAKTTPSQTDTETRSTLNVVFTVNSSSCNTWWIVLVSVIGGIILLLVIFGIVYFSSPKLQHAIRPYKGSN